MTDPVVNPRFADIGGGMQSELIAIQVQLFYDPVTGSARANFNGLPFLTINDTMQALVAVPDILQVDFSNRMTDKVCSGTDPVSGLDLSDLTIAGFMTGLKSAYIVFVQERTDKLVADIAAAEAAAAAAAAAASTPTPPVPVPADS